VGFLRRNAIALVALVIAMGGTSYAAVALPADSVGTKQLRNGAVTLEKLAPDALSTLRGPAGAQGPTGAQGPVGPQGQQGPAGANGTAAAYIYATPGPAFITGGDSAAVVGETLPPGNYVATGQVEVPSPGGQCQLSDPTTDAALSPLATTLQNSVLTLTGVVNSPSAASTLSIVCTSLASAPNVVAFEDMAIDAVQVDTLQCDWNPGIFSGAPPGPANYCNN
jgi:hypothetical protein